MPDDRHSTNDDAILAVPGVLFVGASGPRASTGSPLAASGRSGLRVGPEAGWMVPRGIALWERELSFVARASMTPGLAVALRATLADEQIAPKRFPMAKRAVDLSPLLALTGNLVDEARAQGVRVHTVGVDRVSGDFFYFEEGGEREALRVQGNLVEMLAPSIGSSNTNAELAAALEGLLDRLLLSLSNGAVSELAVELADALPRLSRDGRGMVGTDLEAFEAQANALATRSERWQTAARRIPQALDDAARKGVRSAQVPLFGEARQEEGPALEVLIAGKTVKLPGPRVWTVTGAPREETKPAPAKPSPAPARPAPSPAPSRVVSTPVPARPSPTPTPPRVSPTPVPAKPLSPTPAPSRIVAMGPETPAPTKPTPLRFTPIPPRPAPVAQPAPAPPREPAASALASAPPPEPASEPSAAPEPASEPSVAPEPARASTSESASPSRSATTVRPRRRPTKKSPSTLVLALIALAALAYVAFERFVH